MTATIRDLSQLGEATTTIMDPSTRRRVFRLIDEHWDESRGRYENTWSDQRLATDLKVPRAWVEEIRREAFGDNGGNAEMDELKVALRPLRSASPRCQLRPRAGSMPPSMPAPG